MAPSDRAAKLRAEAKRLARAEAERLVAQNFSEFFDRIEDLAREQFAEAETDIRREYQD